MPSVTDKWQFKALVVTLAIAFGFVTVIRLIFWVVTHPFSWYKKKDRSCKFDFSTVQV